MAKASRPSVSAPGTWARTAAAGWLAADALAVVEVAASEEFPSPAGFARVDERVYGAARLVFLRREPAP